MGRAGLGAAHRRPGAVLVNPASRKTANGGVADGGDDLDGGPGGQPLGVFAHGDIADVVHGIGRHHTSPESCKNSVSATASR